LPVSVVEIKKPTSPQSLFVIVYYMYIMYVL